MLETVKKYANRRVRKTLDEKFIDYMLSVHDMSLQLEIEYFKSHNKLDILKLDRFINSQFKEVL